MIEEAYNDGEGEAKDKDILRIMKKTALRAPGPSATPSPSGMFKVSGTPERCRTPPNLVDDHSGAGHSPHASEPQVTGCGVSFGEAPRSLSTEPCRPRTAFAGPGSLPPRTSGLTAGDDERQAESGISGWPALAQGVEEVADEGDHVGDEDTASGDGWEASRTRRTVKKDIRARGQRGRRA